MGMCRACVGRVSNDQLWVSHTERKAPVDSTESTQNSPTHTLKPHTLTHSRSHTHTDYAGVRKREEERGERERELIAYTC
jgi:hypothetical protein